jgi:uncharacterized membrane protein/YHS domain-containing protein
MKPCLFSSSSAWLIALTFTAGLLLVLQPLPGVAAESTPAQTMCPVLTDEKIDPAISVVYQGKTVYLCCQKCRRKFEATPEKYLAALPQFSSAALAASTSSSITTATRAKSVSPSETSRADADQDEEGEGGALGIIGRFHPLVVHFPIALLLSALLGEMMLLVGRRPFWRDFSQVVLMLGTLGACVAAALGWADAASDQFPGLEAVLFWHRWLGTGTAIAALLTCALAKMARRGGAASDAWWTYRLGLLLCSLGVGIAGHLGATLVYGLNYFKF